MSENGGEDVVTRYGWDGDRLVHEASGTNLTTIVYEPDSVVPMARIDQMILPEEPKSEREEAAAKAMAEAMKIVEMSLAQGGMKLAKPGPRTGTARVSVFVNDHAGTPRKLVNAEGKVIWQAEMDDWGAVARQRGVRQLIRFQGQWEDEESGFYYNRFRYYDPRQGRYITQDPIGLAGGVNPYAYPGNPIGWGDPLGLQKSPADMNEVMCKNAGLSAWCS